MIAVDHVSQRYGRVAALQDISLTIGRGEVVGLVGPSGAGKTTLLRLLAGFQVPAHGTVTIGGHSTARESLAARKLIGYLPEKEPVYAEMRVAEYLSFRAGLKGLAGRMRTKRLREVIGRCGLAGLEQALLGGLSKGEVRRVLLADCLAGAPPVLLMDEPTMGLDPINTARIRAWLAHLRGEHTLVLSSHDMAEAQSLCDRVVVLNRGHLLADAGPGALMAAQGVSNLVDAVTRLVTEREAG